MPSHTRPHPRHRRRTPDHTYVTVVAPHRQSTPDLKLPPSHATAAARSISRHRRGTLVCYRLHATTVARSSATRLHRLLRICSSASHATAAVTRLHRRQISMFHRIHTFWLLICDL
nr:hypothetical protein Iba_chr12eCG5690 [Ipomoea batatas]